MNLMVPTHRADFVIFGLALILNQCDLGEQIPEAKEQENRVRDKDWRGKTLDWKDISEERWAKGVVRQGQKLLYGPFWDY